MKKIEKIKLRRETFFWKNRYFDQFLTNLELINRGRKILMDLRRNSKIILIQSLINKLNKFSKIRKKLIRDKDKRPEMILKKN